jgi:hypothetical protein
MSFFSFANIKFFNKIQAISSPDRLVQQMGSYGYDLYRYPIDLGDTDKGHYMVIYINTQKQTEYNFKTSRDLPTVIQNRSNGTSQSPQQIFATGGSSILGGLDKVVSNFFPNSQATQQISSLISDISGNINQIGLNGTRTIQRTTDAIALYMPDTLAYIHNQQYSDLSLNGFTAAAAATAGSLGDAMDNASAGNIKGLLGNVSPFVARTLQSSDLGRSLFTAVTGKVVNPLLDMIYTSPEFRQFRFDFLFYPRSINEAKQVQQIIQKLYFHQAPEIDTQTSGFFMIPPSEFDIKFYYNGAENPNIPKISTCVLTSIDVDYAPNGFSAYEVANENKPAVGRTGMPVAIRLSLQFKETEIMTKRNFQTSEQRTVLPFTADIVGAVKNQFGNE